MKNKNTGMIWVLCFLFLVAAIALFLFGPPKKKKETLSFVENTATTKQATTPKETPAYLPSDYTVIFSLILLYTPSLIPDIFIISSTF